MLFRHLLTSFTFLLVTLPSPALADAFSDVPEGHFAHEAVEYLKEKGVIGGYDDGTFKPDKAVNRAEALKIIVAPLVTEDQLQQAREAKTAYQDINNDDWYKPYVELARVTGVIDGPPKKERFNGGDSVIKVEFVKMVQEAFGADPQTAFQEIRLPLSQDVTNPQEWYYPYMRYGITSSMMMISPEGKLNPGKNLTRAETAILLYRYIMYEQKRRTQALLSEAESEILIVLAFLDEKDIVEAEYASARALLAARGAHMSRPDEAIVQGAVKITESFRALVRGFRAGTNRDFDETIRLAGESWNLAARGKELDDELANISEQVQNISKGMADSAREQKAADAAQAQE